jgi:hypothetical protein
MSMGSEKDRVARCCIVVALRAFPSLALRQPSFGRPFATWELGFEKFQEKQQQAQERNCHDDLVPAFPFPGIASPQSGRPFVMWVLGIEKDRVARSSFWLFAFVQRATSSST